MEDWGITFLDELQKMKKEMDRVWENLCGRDSRAEKATTHSSRTGGDRIKTRQKARKYRSA